MFKSASRQPVGTGMSLSLHHSAVPSPLDTREGKIEAKPADAASSKMPSSRAKASFHADNIEMRFLEEKSQWAHDSNVSDQWLAANSDFYYCRTCHQICEMNHSFPDERYKSCGHCLQPSYGGLSDMFFMSEGQDYSLEQARTAWLAYLKLMDESDGKMLTKSDLISVGHRERCAWLRYYSLAWERNEHRVRAMRTFTQSPSAFNMLPSGSDAELVLFTTDNTKRHAERTNVGRAGVACNSRPCDMHPGETGHIIQGLGKTRYKSCGICLLPRGASSMQLAADQYDSKSDPRERPTMKLGRAGAHSAAAASSSKR